MVKKWLVGLTVLALLVPFATLSFAQETSVKGNVGGLAVDSTGAVVPGATVTISGATGAKSDKTDEAGNFMFSLLSPGYYSVKVEKQGFKTATVKSVEVLIGKTATIRVTLEPGAVSEVVEVTATAAVVDTTSTAVGANLPDSFYQSVPVPRNVAGLFYITPGAVDGGGTGRSNPSISGASGLENLYMADGVNITDKAFGGLGVFSRRYGSIGSGVNLSFIKEVSVKSGGFEPQYGQATGGVVQMVTKSGGNAFHGEIGAYIQPQDFEAQRNQSDPLRVNKYGLYLNQAAYDVDGEIGGYIPGFKDHLFFFASVDPTWNQQYVHAPLSCPPACPGLNPLGDIKLQADVFNYAGKLTWKINDKHQVESSIFGDPTRTTTGPNTLVLNIVNNTGFSRGNYGTRNWVVRYNGTLTPTWLANFSFTWNNTKFTETPLFQLYGITDRRDPNNIHALQGIGYYEDSKNDSYALNFDTQKIGRWLGQHTLSIGYRYERVNYTDLQTSSGPLSVIPATGAAGAAVFPASCVVGSPDCPIGNTAFQWSGSLRVNAACTLCPIDPATGGRVFVAFGRGDYQPGLTPTFGRYHAAYANDSWEINKHINVSLGLRWEQWRMTGTFSGYTFTDNWAPRLGVAIDPWGDHKTKVFANFGRYNYQTPLDAAIRSLSAEQDVLGLCYAPLSTGGIADTNADGTFNFVLDSAHLLNNQPGKPSGRCGNPIVGLSQTGFAPGTKMMYQNEWVVGAEHQFHNGVVLSARFLYRNLPRTLDDVSGVSPEGYVNGIMTQNYFIGNPSPKTDYFPNANETIVPTGGCPATGPGPAFAPVVEWAQTLGFGTDPTTQVQDANGGIINPATGTTWIPAANSICFIPDKNGFYGGEVVTLPDGSTTINPDGKPDGFPLVVHTYKAVEIEVNKAFANNWMLRANWRIARLAGNYEGAFRNDNGQTDPNISSLFDFTNGFINMLGQQYAVGPLNTDRTHVVNVYASYVFSSTFLKNLEIGTGVQFQSGSPINRLVDHPGYGNAGEVPLGGRGVEGRMPVTGTVNLHLDRPFKVTEKSQLHVTADLFNLTNNKVVTFYDQNYQISFSPDLSPDFLKPGVPSTSWQRPFYARFSARWVF